MPLATKLLGVLAVALFTGHASSALAETFRFRSNIQPEKYSATIGGKLTFPAGQGPFPIVILMHACGGLDRFAQASLSAHARWFINAGFGAYILDSFSARKIHGQKDVCEGGQTARDAEWFRMEDAFNAIDALAKLSKVSKGNIFLVGQSHGAIAALRAAAFRPPNRQRFRAIAAFYPHCRSIDNNMSLASPLIVFAGAKDDWTPPSTCERAKVIDRPAGENFELVVYPSAFHAFDQPRKTVKYRGHTLAYDRAATIDSRKRMLEFFKAHLGPKEPPR